MLVAWCASATAAPWAPAEPYAVPIVNLLLVSVEGDTFAQA